MYVKIIIIISISHPINISLLFERLSKHIFSLEDGLPFVGVLFFVFWGLSYFLFSLEFWHFYMISKVNKQMGVINYLPFCAGSKVRHGLQGSTGLEVFNFCCWTLMIACIFFMLEARGMRSSSMAEWACGQLMPLGQTVQLSVFVLGSIYLFFSWTVLI